LNQGDDLRRSSSEVGKRLKEVKNGEEECPMTFRFQRYNPRRGLKDLECRSRVRRNSIISVKVGIEGLEVLA